MRHLLRNARRPSILPGVLWICLSALCIKTVAATRDFNVRDFGAAGDGQALETKAFDGAILACSNAGGGRVVVPPGRYLSGTIRMRSHVDLHLEEGATLVGTTNLEAYNSFTPGLFKPELRVSRWHRGLILAEGAVDMTFSGKGVIHGSHVFDPRGEERMRGPHGVLLGHCTNVTFRDLLMTNAGNYGLLFFFSDQVTVSNATFAGGWDGVHFRGSTERWCRDVRIVDSRFLTGDDCIAGSYWQDTVISNCVVNSSCNGIRLIGPAVNLELTHCDFFGPGLHEHRTSREQHRTNMLAAICLQPSGWEPMPGPMDNVHIADITMRNITTPFHIVTRQGNTAGSLLVERVKATGAYRAACSVESWGEPTYTNAVFRDCQFGFTGGGTANDAAIVVRQPGVDARKLPAWGLFVRGVKRLSLENVSFSLETPDARPALKTDSVGELSLFNVNFPEPVVTP